MRLVVPHYYKNFRCIGGKCGDNCCIGWGIYIDDKTAEIYRNTDGTFGERLRNNIDFSGEQCFINGTDRRCPFLNNDYLCDIILTLGEDKLCEICDRHPRYFEWLPDSIEGGIGLCCEEAAKLIVNSESFGLCEIEAPKSLADETDDEEDYDEDFCRFLTGARDNILKVINNKEMPLEKTLYSLCEYGKILQDCVDEYEILSVPSIEITDEYDDEISYDIKLMLLFEPIDERQEKYIGNAAKLIENKSINTYIPEEYESNFRNLASYFIWRYFMKSLFDGEVYSSIMLAVFSVKAINILWNTESERNTETLIRTAKYYSKITEYSEENLSVIRNNYIYP